MRWFKHKTDASLNAKLIALRHQFGFEGLGRWWTLCEIVANGARGTSFEVTLPFAEWCSKLVARPQKLRGYLTAIEQLRLICQVEQGQLLTISIPNLAKHKDEYARKSGQTPDRLMPEPEPEARGQSGEQEATKPGHSQDPKRGRREGGSGSADSKPNPERPAIDPDFGLETRKAIELVECKLEAQPDAVADMRRQDKAVDLAVRALGDWSKLCEAYRADFLATRNRFAIAFGQACEQARGPRGSPGEARGSPPAT